jgi:hypothetical protein
MLVIQPSMLFTHIVHFPERLLVNSSYIIQISYSSFIAMLGMPISWLAS